MFNRIAPPMPDSAVTRRASTYPYAMFARVFVGFACRPDSRSDGTAAMVYGQSARYTVHTPERICINIIIVKQTIALSAIE